MALNRYLYFDLIVICGLLFIYSVIAMVNPDDSWVARWKRIGNGMFKSSIVFL